MGRGEKRCWGVEQNEEVTTCQTSVRKMDCNKEVAMETPPASDVRVCPLRWDSGGDKRGRESVMRRNTG